jgi:hypothetical protein
MKKILLFSLVGAWLCHDTIYAQAFVQLGTTQVVDEGNRLLHTSDGGYITAGSADGSAVLYKTDCLGNLVAQIEKTVSPGPATFWDVIELSDGSIVALGSAQIVAPLDTGNRVFLLKTNAMLEEISTNSFPILGKNAVGKSIAATSTGHLLVWGEVMGISIDFTDAFFQRVDPITLEPTDNPVIFNNGVDRARRILPTSDGNFLLAGDSFIGNVFDPEAIINNILRAYKVDENGALIWEANVSQTSQTKQGLSQVAGVTQNMDSGNFMLGGTLFGGTDDRKQDAFFALIGPDGTVLDTSYAAHPGQQRLFSIIAQKDIPGLYSMVGESDGATIGVPSIAIAQAYEQGNLILISGVTLDPTTLVSLRDITEIDPGRVAYMGTLPDNPIVLNATDIIIGTPGATAGIVYQNCALAATLSAPASAFQWSRDGQIIQGANQGVYFPTQAGLYQVQILDQKGCYGVSDTFRVDGPTADFVATPDGLMTTFDNTSQGGTTYAWNFGDGSTSALSEPTHTFTSTGVYSVQLIVTNNCGLKDTTIQQIGVTSAAEPSWLSYFELAPNPSTGLVTIEMRGVAQGKVSFTLFNAIGQTALVDESSFQNGWLQKTFNLEQLPAGVYYLQIRSGKEAKNVRLVKG